MSFLGDLVNSIGTDKAPALPKPPPRPPIASSAAHSNPAPRPKPLPTLPTASITGQKRKLDERDAKDTKITKPPENIVKSNPAPSLTSKIVQKPVSQLPNGIKPSAPRPPATVPSNVSSVPTKPPSKGSFAEIMARAKEAQQSRTPNPVGTIKHQSSHKEKVSKLAERRRQEQEKLKGSKDKRSEKPLPSGKLNRKRGASPAKKSEPAKVPRAPRPPLHAPASSYKGTMGTSSKKPREERGPKKSRYDEYLGTDEEENSDMDEDGDEDEGYGYSDASSDMEAGINDIDMEENQSSRAAREDDAKELAIENQLKREKEERRRRLAAMAKKNR